MGMFLTPFFLRLKGRAEVYADAHLTVRCMMQVNGMDVTLVVGATGACDRGLLHVILVWLMLSEVRGRLQKHVN